MSKYIMVKLGEGAAAEKLMAALETYRTRRELSWKNLVLLGFNNLATLDDSELEVALAEYIAQVKPVGRPKNGNN